MRALMLMTAVLAAAVGSEAAAQVTVTTGRGGFAYAMGDPDRAMIGVSTRNSGKRDTLGLLVDAVTRDGPAEKAGIEEGDRLVSVNNVNLRLSAADAGESDMDGVANRRLIRELEKQKAGDEVELRVYRDGNTRSVRVKTVAAEELNKRAYATTAGGMLRRVRADRAALGVSLGGNGSRRDTLGVLVVGVANEGPAAKAGIDEGDRVAAINGVDLRVASEDAGDSQASHARINRLNREMEKVKAGDAVELRVYSAGQVKTVRVESVKASEIEGDGFGFFFDNGAETRAFTLPRAAVRVRPPSVEFDGFQTKAAAKVDMERALRTFNELKLNVEPKLKLNVEPKFKLNGEQLKSDKVTITRKLRIA